MGMIGWLVMGGVISALVIYVIVAFNRLVRQRNVVREGWSGVEVQLKRRADLVPNLVETVKAYAAHERSLFEEIAAERAAGAAAHDMKGQAVAAQALSAAIGRLVFLAEGYPELRANQNFLGLQTELAEIEDQIQMARRYYNGAVRNLNISIQSFPDIILAARLGFTEEPFFELEPGIDATTPQIRFLKGHEID
jgi:LemA protein